MFQEKELSLYHELRFANPYIFATQCRRPQIFPTMKSIGSNKSEMFTTSGFNDIMAFENSENV